jgi:hypothetical protein
VYLKIDVAGQNQWVKYASKAGVQIVGQVGKDTELDGRIYIQTHWGSGVKFKDIQITNGYNPPIPPTPPTN